MGTRRQLIATCALVLVCVVWGSTFIVVKDAVDRMPVLDFLVWRFGIATAALVLVRPSAALSLGRRGVAAGVALGIALGGGYLAQTYGLRTTPASISGFITGMLVVFTPLVAGLVLRRHVGMAAWASVGLATLGLGLITLHGFSVGSGEAITLLCALSFAVHIVGLGEWSPSYDAVGLTVVQAATVTVMCAVAGAPGGIEAPPDLGVWGALLLTGLLATAVGFLVQTWTQSLLSPIRAAITLSTEPVFAGVFGVAVGGDSLGWRTLVGAACVLVAMVTVEAGPRRGAEGEVARLE
jgi:drug/metabolite transporter (DMT)-like permease